MGFPKRVRSIICRLMLIAFVGTVLELTGAAGHENKLSLDAVLPRLTSRLHGMYGLHRFVFQYGLYFTLK